MVLAAAAGAFFAAYFGLYIGLHNVNLGWTNEISVIKQGTQVLAALLAGWALPVLLILPYMLALHGVISATAYLALLALAAAAAGLAFRGWLHKAGVRRFEAL